MPCYVKSVTPVSCIGVTLSCFKCASKRDRCSFEQIALQVRDKKRRFALRQIEAQNAEAQIRYRKCRLAD